MTSISRRRLLLGAATALGVAAAGCLSPPSATDGTRRPGQRRDGQSGPHSPMHSGQGTPYGPMGPGQGPGQHTPMGPHRDGTAMGPHHGGGGRGTGGGGTGGGAGGTGTGETLEQWFSNVDNYGGVIDRTGRRTVTVDVGAPGNGGAFAFDPPAVRVSRGTTVTWEWTGDGGSHDVVAVDGSFESPLHSAAGATFTHTFDDAGTYRYYCTPHRPLGMKGAVVVE